MIIVLEQIERATREECELNPFHTQALCVSVAEREGGEIYKKGSKEGLQANLL